MVRPQYEGRPAPRRELKSSKLAQARPELKIRIGDVASGRTPIASLNRIGWEEAVEDILNDYRNNGKRSLSHVERRLAKHLTPFFRRASMAGIRTVARRRYVAHRQKQGVVTAIATATSPEVRRPPSNAELNCEAAILKRMFNLAVPAGKLTHKPFFRCWRRRTLSKGSSRTRSGKPSCRISRQHCAPVVEFAAITGWRIPSEFLKLEWRHVPLDEGLSPQQEVPGVVRLEPGTTKNGRGREFPCTEAL